MRRTRLIIAGFILGLAAIGVAATYYPDGMLRFYGDSTLTTLKPGAAYFNTSSQTLFMGGASSNPVPVASSASYSNTVGTVTVVTITNSATLSTQTYIQTIGAITLTLPTASTGKLYRITKTDTGTTLTINGGTIENDTSAIFDDRWSFDVICDGNRWWIR